MFAPAGSFQGQFKSHAVKLFVRTIHWYPVHLYDRTSQLLATDMGSIFVPFPKHPAHFLELPARDEVQSRYRKESLLFYVDPPTRANRSTICWGLMLCSTGIQQHQRTCTHMMR